MQRVHTIQSIRNAAHGASLHGHVRQAVVLDSPRGRLCSRSRDTQTLGNGPQVLVCALNVLSDMRHTIICVLGYTDFNWKKVSARRNNHYSGQNWEFFCFHFLCVIFTVALISIVNKPLLIKILIEQFLDVNILILSCV